MTALLLKTLDPSLIVVHVSRHLVLILDRKLLAYVYIQNYSNIITILTLSTYLHITSQRHVTQEV